jgi:hypothetical protein
MRDVPASIPAALSEGSFVGDARPVARVTVQHPNMFLRNYTLMSTFSYKKVPTVKGVPDAADAAIDPTKGMKVHQTYADFLFTGLPNLLAHLSAVLQPALVASGLSTAAVAATARLSRQSVARACSGVALPTQSALGNKIDPKVATLRIAHALGVGAGVIEGIFKYPASVEIPQELPNVKSVQWTRSIDTDVADCTIECWNTKPLEIGQTPRAGELDLPGYFTYDRGATAFGKARWGHVRNEWFGMLMPDNIIRTYEGYGCDPDVIPELDPNLVQTGVWIIDSVTMSDTGTLSVKCRDIGRILLDQQFYAPVVPDDFYDEDWQGWDETFPGDPITTKAKLKVTPEDSSNTPWIGSGVVAGHTLAAAFDGHPNTYWLSIGNAAPSRRFAYEWVQATVKNQSVTRVRLRTKKKGYIAYVSVMVAGVWQGKTTIDYHRDGIGQNGGNIPYVISAPISTEGFVEIALPKAMKKVQRIRITLGNLQNFHFGTYDYRGGIRDVEVYGVSTTTTPKIKLKVGPIGSNPGRYFDYTDLVKLFCAWGGFFWPSTGRLRLSDGTYRDCAPLKYDTKTLGAGVKGRIWGDFQNSGTFGPAELTLDNFDKKALMDCISYVRDILGFVFYIDETGACVWRQPNIHDYGCRWSAFSQNAGVYVRGSAHQIDEDTILTGLSAVLDAKNVREAFFVGDVYGKIGAFAPGFNPNPTGLRRIAGWTDQNFTEVAECQLMADMLSLRQLFTYRVDKVTIPANPAIQIDDQIRINERTTADGYVHYVKGISSSLDMTSGQWTYDMDTHWLGYDRPDAKWLFNPGQLSPTTQAYLDQLKATQAAGVYARTQATVTS